MTSTVNTLRAKFISSTDSGSTISNFTSIISPQKCDIVKHIDNTYNIYLNYPCSAYNIFLSEGDLIRDNIIDNMNSTGTYVFRNIFRGQENKDINTYSYLYDQYVKNNFDRAIFSSKLRFINQSADVVNVRIDTSSFSTEFGAEKNWSMTTVSNIDYKQVFRLEPSWYLLMDAFFELKTIYIEDIKVIKADIHEVETTWAYQYQIENL